MTIYIGIDIGKHELQIHFNGDDQVIKNSTPQIKKFLSSLPKSSNFICVFESTGGYEKILKDLLSSQELPYHMVHANRVRAFAKSLGQQAKTDPIDAKMLVRFAEANKLEGQTIKLTSEQAKIRSLVCRREQLISDKSSEFMRIDKQLDKEIQASIKRHIKWLDKEIDCIEKKLEELTKNEASIRQAANLLQSIPAIGKFTAYTLISYLPEMTCANRKELAALVGVAPYNRDSGKHKGKRYIFGGRKIVRKALYMAAVSSLRHSKEMQLFYQRLKAKGKPSKVALVAIMNKLIGVIHSVMKRGTPWVQKYQHVA